MCLLIRVWQTTGKMVGRNVKITGRTERSLGRMHLIPRISSVAAGGIYENRNLDDL
jgi:hypothetical protein